MKNLLLVDVSNALYRGCAVNQRLSFKGEPTGAIYGLLNMLGKQMEDLLITDMAFCWDHKPYLRVEDYPGYKADRVKDDNKPNPMAEMVFKGKAHVAEFSKEFGIPTLDLKGLECDDWMALVCDARHQDFDKIYLMSNDSDLFQLLCYDNVYCLLKAGEYCGRTFRLEHRMEPDDWAPILCMTGTHNGVPGVHGIGTKKAARIYQDPDKYEAFKKEHKDMLIRNEKLVYLPHDSLLDNGPEIPERFQMPKFHERDMTNFLLRNYGISATTKMLSGFGRISA